MLFVVVKGVGDVLVIGIDGNVFDLSEGVVFGEFVDVEDFFVVVFC